MTNDSARRRRIGLMGAAVIVAAGAVAIAVTSSSPSCRSERGGAPAAPSSPPPDCQTKLEGSAPQLGPLAAPSLPGSRVAVEVEVDTTWLAAQLDKKVPTQLAAESRRPVGKAGEVTYAVNRGPFVFSVADDRLTVTVPVSATVEVCKPVGPFCPTYGSCTPRAVVSGSVPLVVKPEYKLDESRASYGINEGCSIVGLDVTDKIRSAADGRIGQIKSQLDQALPDVEALAKEAFATFSRPLALPGGGCVRAHADEIVQGHPRLDAGAIVFRAAMPGKVELFPAACPEVAAGGLPPIRIADEVAGDGSIGAAVLLPWDAAQKDLASSLAGVEVVGDGGTSRVGAVTLHRGMLDGKPTLVLGVALDGLACGEAFVRAGLRHDPEKGDLRLDAVEPLAGQPDALAAVSSALSERGSISAPPLLRGLLAELASIERRLDEFAAAKLPAKPTVELAPAAVSAHYGPDGITLVAERRGRARLVLK